MVSKNSYGGEVKTGSDINMAHAEIATQIQTALLTCKLNNGWKLKLKSTTQYKMCEHCQK